jgi:hypothetical protein
MGDTPSRPSTRNSPVCKICYRLLSDHDQTGRCPNKVYKGTTLGDGRRQSHGHADDQWAETTFQSLQTAAERKKRVLEPYVEPMSYADYVTGYTTTCPTCQERHRIDQEHTCSQK